MTLDQEKALGGLVKATLKLLEHPKLAYSNPGEPVLTGELGHLLRTEFPEWDVSNEYDRREQETKKLRRLDENENAIIPDILVHQIGQKNNLLAIEAKRIENRDFEKDIWKLKGLTKQNGQYAYAVGVHLVLNMRKQSIAICNVYVDGGLDAALTKWLQGRLPIQ